MIGPELMTRIAVELVGTCQSLEVILNSYDRTSSDMTVADAAVLDENAWLCDGCGWWVEPEEINDENLCEQCAEDSTNSV